jgi:prolipoprotein diacylglyceryl transferase
MHPVLFHIGSLGVGSHNFFVTLGVLAATAVYFAEARRRGVLSEDVAVIALGTLLFGGIAARLSTAWQYVEVTGDSPVNAWANGGKSILGGLAGAYAGALITKRWLGYREHTGDLFAPAVALGMAIGRIGCFLSEEPGTPTRLPWGVHVSPEAAAQIPRCAGCAAGVAMHPSFLYEIAFQCVMFVVLMRLRRSYRSNGSDLLKIYLLAYAVFRFFVEFVRGNDVWVGGLTRSQVFLIPATVLLVGYFRRRARPQPSEGAVMPGAPDRERQARR